MDVLIRGAVVYDGSGAPGRQLDVAVRGERIAALGADAASAAGAGVVDAGGLALAPGFIDLHSHADLTLPAFPRATNSLSQGVTTELVGLCGFSPAPVSPLPERAEQLRRFAHGIGPDLDWGWQDVASYLDRLAAARPAVNVAALVGHGALRIAAMGTEDRPPSEAELQAMRADLRAALAAGAWGLSTGLVYVPGTFSTTEELLALGEELQQVDALYVSHIRNEGDHLLEAVDECLAIGERLGIRSQVSHLKSTGRRNAGRMVDALARIEAARGRGARAQADVYPYTAGSTFLHQVLPPWVKEGGLDSMVERLRISEQRLRIRHDLEHGLPGWSNQLEAADGWHNVLIASVGNPARQAAEGRRVADLARQAGVDPLDYTLDLLVDDRGGTVMVSFTINEADMHLALGSRLTAIGSDQLGVTSPTARVHPRAYGTFARVLGWGVREAGLFPLETAIWKMTGLSADMLGLRDRGRVAVGQVADLVLFDPRAVADRSTYEEPTRTAVGIEQVLVAGEPAVEGGRVQRADLGRVLRPAAAS